MNGACFGKQRNNLLVEAECFYHFSGIILYNVKHIQCNCKKFKIIFQQVLYTLMLSFLKLIELLLTFSSHKTFLVLTDPL